MKVSARWLKSNLALAVDVFSAVPIVRSITDFVNHAVWPLWFTALVAGSAAWLTISFFTRWRHIRPVHKPTPAKPTVLVMGGPQFQAVIDEIVQAPALQHEPFIKFLPIGSQDHQVDATKMASAHSVLVMPDVTAATEPAAYHQLKKLSAAIPVVRFYPHAFDGARLDDFPILRFSTVGGLVSYGSEELLVQATEHGRAIEASSRRSSAVMRALILIFAATASLVPSLLMSLDAAQKREALSGMANDALSNFGTRLHLLLTGISAAGPRDQTHRTVGALSAWVQLAMVKLAIAANDPMPKALVVFGLSTDRKLLIPVHSDGTNPYVLDFDHSIAGCAARNNLLVLWRGHRDSTQTIEAWTLDGARIGSYDQESHRLNIPGQAPCDYQGGKGESRRSTLCGPTTAAGNSRQPVAVCISTDAVPGYFASSWFHKQFLELSTLLTAIDLGPILDSYASLASSGM